jgi:tetratricopeptide (TPR) repeat protein
MSIAKIEKTVFLSYRRTNASWALAIFHDLTRHGFDVFFDFHGIASGDFERVILNNIEGRAHFVVLLTPSALEKCGDPADWFRREIETALKTRRNIVPLMLEGFDFGANGIAQHLAGALAPLQAYNALRIPAEYFDEAMKRLRERFLNVPLDAVLHPVTAAARRAAKAQQTAAAAKPAVPQRELTAEEWYERGHASEDPEEKVRLFRQAIRLKPDFDEPYVNIACILRDRGDVDGALKELAAAIRLQSWAAYVVRSEIRSSQGNTAGAIKDLDACLRLKPEFAFAYHTRACMRESQGDIEGALQDLDETIRLDPDDELDALHHRAVLRQDRGDEDGALEDYSEAIRLKPETSAAAFINRSQILFNRGDIDAALDDLNEAIRLDRTFPEAFYNRANALASLEDLDGAIRDYTEAIRLRPDYASAYYNRSLARERNGDRRGAKQDMTEVRRLKAE